MINQELKNYLNKKVLSILNQKYRIKLLERNDEDIMAGVSQFIIKNKDILGTTNILKNMEYTLKDKKKCIITLASNLNINIKPDEDEILILVPEQLDLKTFKEDKKTHDDFIKSIRAVIECATLNRSNIYKSSITE